MSAKTVSILVEMTPAQLRVVRRAARRLRCTPEEYIAAASMSEIEGWHSSEEFVCASIAELVRFVDERRVPRLAP